jgi:hypothetical protein
MPCVEAKNRTSPSVELGAAKINEIFYMIPDTHLKEISQSRYLADINVF